MTRARLLGTTSNQMLVYMASRQAASNRITTLDKIYSRLMLGRKATIKAKAGRKRRDPVQQKP